GGQSRSETPLSAGQVAVHALEGLERRLHRVVVRNVEDSTGKAGEARERLAEGGDVVSPGLRRRRPEWRRSSDDDTRCAFLELGAGRGPEDTADYPLGEVAVQARERRREAGGVVHEEAVGLTTCGVMGHVALR